MRRSRIPQPIIMERSYRFAHRIVPEECMFTRIIVPLDGSVAAERAILTAAVLTRRSRACIDLVHVRRPPLWAAGAPMYDTRLDDEEARKESTIAARAAVLVASGLNVHCTNLEGEVNDALELYAAESDADLIVMSSGGAHTSRGAMGKVARHLVRSAGVPVLLVRGSGAEARTPAEPLFARVLVPLDGSPISERVLDLAASLAIPGESEILLARVVAQFVVMSEPGAGGGVYPNEDDLRRLRATALSYLEDLGSQLSVHGFSVRTLVLSGQSVERELLSLAEAQCVDLLVMSTHARQSVARFFMGSVASVLARDAASSVLLYHPSEQVYDVVHARDDRGNVDINSHS
jgi:nucleotide-binding universal stress UspA family protein